MWILILTAIIFPTIVLLMPKRIPRMYLYATAGMATYFQLLTDVFLHIELNWYGYFNPWPRSEWKTMWLVPIYLSVTPLFLNFYPYHRSTIAIVSYILGWSLFSVIYEELLVQLGVFYHNQWKLYHSAMAYPVLFMLLRLQLTWVQKLSRKDKN
ncbi:hypothetical protein [Salinibacillus xinjiangensis]|uniref:Uncharacterized protein n=1 Tax=Salinibacillus xinjiangensis TaxID=1229268 RepID=A0A6G1X8A6_9BACI|nr:hypothetical protein [Salinibacillus xinjiangensis]MRG87177.1 hypothetical protein [Salinibacillus xinjiangensis]